ncbi:MAG: tRNA 2-selenouridine(34) synthase MnmH [Pyrinomonadaceae bacterium]
MLEFADRPTSPLTDFKNGKGPILDVRSPVEFERGHIPGAISFPLFSNDERQKIGIVYNRSGSDKAIKMGFDFANPKRAELIEKALELAPNGRLRVHCWRGGLRSKSVAWLLSENGFEVIALRGGYKSYRNWVLETVARPMHLVVVRGLTGAGKTRLLHALERLGEQILDLEGLANHRGSSFGGLGMDPQPTTQQFGNVIAETLNEFDFKKTIWIEAESSRIGECWVPDSLMSAMKTADSIEIRRSFDERLRELVEVYGKAQTSELAKSTRDIEKRLGGKRTQDVLSCLKEADIEGACTHLLGYYDSAYNNFTREVSGEQLIVDITGLTDTEAAKIVRESVSKQR